VQLLMQQHIIPCFFLKCWLTHWLSIQDQMAMSLKAIVMLVLKHFVIKLEMGGFVVIVIKMRLLLIFSLPLV
jgi:hypothetical protein